MKSHAGLGLGTVRNAFVKSYGTVEEQQKIHLPTCLKQPSPLAVLKKIDAGQRVVRRELT